MSVAQTLAAGYQGADLFYLPPTLTGEIVYDYHRCALTPALAKSNFLRNGQMLMCGSRVIYGRLKRMHTFGYNTDNNEDPPITAGPQVTPQSMTICQSFKFDIKLSELDRQFMCANYDQWVRDLQRQIDDNIMDEIDGYSVPLILMSAHSDNVGVHAGELNHLINLGGQGGTGNEPLPMTSMQDFANLVFNVRAVQSQAGWRCDARETPMHGDGVNRPVMVIPQMLERYALQYIADYEQGCCGPNSVIRVGQIGVIAGMDVIVSERLQPAVMGGTNLIAPVLVVDPDQILHAMDIIVNKIWVGKFDQHFVGQGVYDTHVINPRGIIVANVAVS